MENSQKDRLLATKQDLAIMPVIKRTNFKGFGSAIVTDKVRSYANDPFFIKQAAEAKEALSKTDLSILKKK